MKRILLLPAILLFFTCASQKIMWDKSLEQNTVQGYEMYLENYPDGKYSLKAKDKIDRLNFYSAKKINTIESYSNYLQNFSNGNFISKAKKEIEYLAYQNAEKTIDGLNNYLSKYPNGTYKYHVEGKIEELHFEKAKSLGTSQSFQEYVSMYPNGYYIKDIEKEHIGVLDTRLSNFIDMLKTENDDDLDRTSIFKSEYMEIAQDFSSFKTKYPDNPNITTIEEKIVYSSFLMNPTKNNASSYWDSFPFGLMQVDAWKFISENITNLKNDADYHLLWNVANDNKSLFTTDQLEKAISGLPYTATGNFTNLKAKIICCGQGFQYFRNVGIDNIPATFAPAIKNKFHFELDDSTEKTHLVVLVFDDNVIECDYGSISLKVKNRSIHLPEYAKPYSDFKIIGKCTLYIVRLSGASISYYEEFSATGYSFIPMKYEPFNKFPHTDYSSIYQAVENCIESRLRYNSILGEDFGVPKHAPFMIDEFARDCAGSAVDYYNRDAEINACQHLIYNLKSELIEKGSSKVF